MLLSGHYVACIASSSTLHSEAYVQLYTYQDVRQEVDISIFSSFVLVLKSLAK